MWHPFEGLFVILCVAVSKALKHVLQIDVTSLSWAPRTNEQTVFYCPKNTALKDNPHFTKHSTFLQKIHISQTIHILKNIPHFVFLKNYQHLTKKSMSYKTVHNWQNHKLLEVLPRFCGSEKKWQLRLQNDQFCKTIHLCKRIHISKEENFFGEKVLKCWVFNKSFQQILKTFQKIK